MFDLGIFNSSDRTLPFRLDVIQRSAGESLFITDEWPLAAADAIASGLDGPALVELACQYASTDSVTIRELVADVQSELDLAQTPERDAARFLGLVVCDAVVRGFVDPPTAMDLIFPLFQSDDMYLAFADAWDWDIPEYREYITENVMEAAKRQLASMPGTLEEMLVRITTAGFESALVGYDNDASTRLPDLDELQDDVPINVESERQRSGWLATIVQRIRP